VIDQREPFVRTGDALPFYFGMASDKRFYSSETQAGRAAVMILIGPTAMRNACPMVATFVRHAEAFASYGADLLILGTDDVVRLLTSQLRSARLVYLIDCGNEFLVRCDVQSAETVALVVDRNRRIMLRLPLCAKADVVDQCLDCLSRLPSEFPCDVVLPAPVLMLPNLLGRDLCRRLITLFESRPNMEGEIASIDHAGVPQSRVDHAKKRRRDVPISPTDEMYPVLREMLLRRCAPQIARAFHANISNIDRLLVARYDDTGGWFRRHRDNMGENVAFREFAISVNLNTEEYEGGHLLFPEHNDHRYRPPTGGGIIFSASLLHEASAVTSGNRYVLLTFFYGDAGKARQQDYIMQAGG
jgi:predicted 2-oxoglutarate/Fe(II)-dependent dioxygenase YbiX